MENNFQWTDELVAEFTTWSLKSSPAFQGRYADIEQFKEMKAPKPTYEILSFIHKGGEVIWKKECDGQFHTGDTGAKLPLSFFTDGWVKENFLYEIHSLKRLSDGVIFTLGDYVRYNKTVTNYPLYKIVHFGFTPFDQIMVVGERELGKKFTELLEDCEKAETHPQQLKLFTTEDGVDVFPNDIIWVVFKDIWTPQPFKVLETPNFRDPVAGIFSSESAAQSLILANKPIQVSLSELLKYMSTPVEANDRFISARQWITDFFKTKINP